MKIYTDEELTKELYECASKLNIMVNLSVKNKDTINMRKYMKAFNNVLSALDDINQEK
jgi:hypothetical protein